MVIIYVDILYVADSMLEISHILGCVCVWRGGYYVPGIILSTSHIITHVISSILQKQAEVHSWQDSNKTYTTSSSFHLGV